MFFFTPEIQGMPGRGERKIFVFSKTHCFQNKVKKKKLLVSFAVAKHDPKISVTREKQQFISYLCYMLLMGHCGVNCGSTPWVIVILELS